MAALPLAGMQSGLIKPIALFFVKNGAIPACPKKACQPHTIALQ